MDIKKVAKSKFSTEDVDKKNTGMEDAKRDTVGEKTANKKRDNEKNVNDNDSKAESVKKENINKENINKSDIIPKNNEKKDVDKKIIDVKKVNDKKDDSVKDAEMKKSEENDAGKKNIFKRIFKWPFYKLKLKTKTETKVKAKRTDLKKINFKNINIKKTVSGYGKFWFRHYRIIFILLFFLTFAVGVLFWYQKLYNSQWSDEKKQQYTISQKAEVNFRENKFQDVVKAIENRKSAYENEFKTLNNIFQLTEEDKDKK